ncbi:MAG: hypothetical protein KIT84_00965 [Labilithrix sp.]|nr:hypothetical protein [Labilithrix sp.]MCW5809555.1 hypothetical protein [Labilithrix sp.]
MRALILTLPFAIAFAAATSAEAADAGAPAPPPPPVPACVRVATESRYVPYGYNHVVILENGCSKNAVCTVATDVNPEKRSVEVPAGTTVEVTTFMGSASQTFVASVGCTLR